MALAGVRRSGLRTLGLPFAEKINKLDVGGLGDQQMRTHVMPVGAILVFASGLSACADRERVGSASSPSEEAAYNAGAARRDYDRSVADRNQRVKCERLRRAARYHGSQRSGPLSFLTAPTVAPNVKHGTLDTKEAMKNAQAP